MKCDKCGNQVTETDRICKNCGELNPHNPNNKNLLSMVKHSGNARNNAFQSSIDKNALRASEPQSQYNNLIRTEGPNASDFNTETPTEQTQQKQVKDNNIKMPKLMIIADILFAILLLSPSLLFPKLLIVNIVGAAISFIYMLSTQMLVVKAKEPWWSLYIPIYNIYVINKICFRNGWFWTILFIPAIMIAGCALIQAQALIPTLLVVEAGVSLVYSLALTYQLGNRYGMNGILMILFGIILLPIVGLSSKYTYLG